MTITVFEHTTGINDACDHACDEDPICANGCASYYFHECVDGSARLPPEEHGYGCDVRRHGGGDVHGLSVCEYAGGCEVGH